MKTHLDAPQERCCMVGNVCAQLQAFNAVRSKHVFAVTEVCAQNA
jgi:hypothetical protein